MCSQRGSIIYLDRRNVLVGASRIGSDLGLVSARGLRGPRRRSRLIPTGTRIGAATLIACSIVIGLFAPVCSVAIIVTLGIVMCLNADMFRFFAGRRGWVFAVMSIPLHLLYYVYCGLGFFVGCMIHLWSVCIGLPQRHAIRTNLSSQSAECF